MRLALLLLVLGCHGTPSAPTPPKQPQTYKATIRWTSHGIPHITANDLGGLAFGQGYAFATHHVCVMADQRIKLRSERSKWFGPGERDANIESDFGWLALEVRDLATRALPSLSDDSRALLRGFAAGYNRYLADTKDLPPDCAGAAWVQPLDEVDLLAHWIQISVLGSTGFFLDSIASARPPGGPSARLVAPPDLYRPDAPASNGWAIGAERSVTGRGLLVANPHFPWEGELRFFESHLTIPGTLDAYGVNLLGLPLISIGFTERLAWTHTFSSSRRFVIYRVGLVGGDPTKYRYGDETRTMTKRVHTIEVRESDGSVRKLERATYRTHHGPVISNAYLPWSVEHAFALRDVAGGNLGALDQYLAMIRAPDRAGFEMALARWQATGFVNTIYADRDGNALYVDGSAVPDLAPIALGALGLARATIPALKEAWERGVVIADGSDPLFELQIDPKSARPGAIGYARAPRLLRRDFVANANDSYWLANPAAPMTGFSPLYGEPETLPSERTRMNLRYLLTTDNDGKFDVAELKTAILDHRATTSELLHAAVVDRCKAARSQPIERACKALAGWDGRYDVTSKGAILWRELLSAYPGTPYAVPFDPARPLETPSGLVPAPSSGDDPIVTSLAAAVEKLELAGVDPYGTLGDAQWTDKRGRRIAVPGSGPFEGSTNPAFFSTGWNTTRLPRSTQGTLVNPSTGLAQGGYPINYGTSFLAVVGFTDAGPVAHAILTYSASSDPRSPQFRDQTELYSRKEWRRVLFRAADIERDPALRVQTVCSTTCD